MRKSFLCFVSLAAALIATTNIVLAQETVKIGAILSYSGQFADNATQVDNGIKLYMKEHGNTVAGKTIELLRRDDAGAGPDLAKRLAQELVTRDKADLFTGLINTVSTLAVGDIANLAKKFSVVMEASASIITTKSPYFTRTFASGPQLNYVLGLWAAKNGLKRIYTMASDFAPGIEAETWFQNGAKQGGSEIIGSVRIPPENSDFSAFVQKAKDANPDAIYIWIPSGTQSAGIGKALVERGIDTSKIKILGQDTFVDENTLKGIGDTAIGFITVAAYDYNHKSDLNDKFVKAFYGDYRRNPDAFALGGYDGMHLIYEALKKTGGKTDGDALIEAAKGMTWESPRGKITIDPRTRDIVQTVYIRRVERVGNELRNVEIDKFDDVKDPAKEPKQ